MANDYTNRPEYTATLDFQTIRIEEYIFGNKAGMGPIGWTETLAQKDTVFLYDMIETFQGISAWETERWALSWCKLPSGKIGVTAIFPDTDLSGRSTVFGHTIILASDDFGRIAYNPFVLQTLGFFSKNKDLPETLPPKTIDVPAEEVDRICRQAVENRPEGFEQLFRAVLKGQKSLVGTAVPANRMINSLVCCLPPVARSQFTFSSLEVPQPSPDVGRGEKSRRRIFFAAVSEAVLGKLGPISGVEGYVFKDGQLTSTGKDVSIALPAGQEKFYQTVKELLAKGEDINALYNMVDREYGRNLRPEELTAGLIELTNPEAVVCNHNELLSRRHRYGADSKQYFDLCIRSFKAQKEANEWRGIHREIEQVASRVPIEKYWTGLKLAYLKLIETQPAFGPHLFELAVNLIRKDDYRRKFQRDVLPLLTKEIEDQARSVAVGEFPLVALVDQLSSRFWLKFPDIQALLERLFVQAVKQGPSEALEKLALALVRLQKKDALFRILDERSQIESGGDANHFSTVLKAISMALLRTGYAGNIYAAVGIVKRFRHCIVPDDLDKIAERIVDSVASSQNLDAMARILPQYADGFLKDWREYALKRLADVCRFSEAAIVAQVFGLPDSLPVIMRRKQISTQELPALLNYLRLAVKYYKMEGQVVPPELQNWLRLLNIDNYVQMITHSDRDMLRDHFNIKFDRPVSSHVLSYSSGPSRSGKKDGRTHRSGKWFETTLIAVLSILIVGIVFMIALYYIPSLQESLWSSGKVDPNQSNEETAPKAQEPLSKLEEYRDKTASTEWPSADDPVMGYETDATNSENKRENSTQQKIEQKKIRKIPGRLHVDTNVPGAIIRITNIKPKFEQDMELDPGEYDIEVSYEGYKTARRKVTVEGGKVKNEKFKLEVKEPAYGTVSIRTDPSNAELKIQRVGGLVPDFERTPFKNTLPAGRYRIEISHPNYKTKLLEIPLESGKPFTEFYELSPLVTVESNIGEKLEQKPGETVIQETPKSKPKFLPIPNIVVAENEVGTNQIELGRDRESLELMAEDYKRLLKEKFKGGEAIKLIAVEPETMEPIRKSKSSKLVFGKITLQHEKTNDYHPWKDKPFALKWTYKTNLPPDNGILRLKLNQKRPIDLPVDLPHKKFNLFKYLDNEGLLKADNTIKFWLVAEVDGRIAFQSNSIQLNVCSGPLTIHRNGREICSLGDRTTMDLGPDDYETLWKNGVQGGEKVDCYIGTFQKTKTINYGSANVKLRKDGSKIMVSIHAISYLAENDLKPILILKNNNSKTDTELKKSIFSSSLTWEETFDDERIIDPDGNLVDKLTVIVEFSRKRGGEPEVVFRGESSISP